MHVILSSVAFSWYGKSNIHIRIYIYIQLFITQATKKTVTPATLARWLNLFKLGAINTVPIRHSHIVKLDYRVHTLRAPPWFIQRIVSTGNWTTTNTFNEQYKVPYNHSTVDIIILQQLMYSFMVSLSAVPFLNINDHSNFIIARTSPLLSFNFYLIF